MAKPEIMVIDENTKILFAFESLLEKEGYITITAESGYQALLKITAKKPRAIFVDISLPEKNNLETIARIQEKASAIPIILLTSQHMHEADALVDKYDASGYLEKPISIEGVRDILKTLGIKQKKNIRKV